MTIDVIYIFIMINLTLYRFYTIKIIIFSYIIWGFAFQTQKKTKMTEEKILVVFKKMLSKSMRNCKRRRSSK